MTASPKFVGRYVEWPCNACAAPMASIEMPGPDSRFCLECMPIPLDAPSGQLDVGAAGMAELITRQALRNIEARDWLQAECRLVNALAYVRAAQTAVRRER